jgi:hypothetical protein
MTRDGCRSLPTSAWAFTIEGVTTGFGKLTDTSPTAHKQDCANPWFLAI